MRPRPTLTKLGTPTGDPLHLVPTQVVLRYGAFVQERIEARARAGTSQDDIFQDVFVKVGTRLRAGRPPHPVTDFLA